MCWTPLYANEQYNVNEKFASYKQLEVTKNRTSCYAEIVTDITTRNSERKDTQ